MYGDVINHLLTFYIFDISKFNFDNLCKILLYVLLLICLDLVIIHKNNLLGIVITYYYNYGSSNIIYELNGIL